MKLAINEDFTDSTIFALFFIYLTGRCDVTLLEEYLSKSEINLLLEINKDYVYFGFDKTSNTFIVPKINSGDLLKIFTSKFRILWKYFKINNKHEFCEKLISILVENKNIDSAAQVACVIGNQQIRENCLNR